MKVIRASPVQQSRQVNEAPMMIMQHACPGLAALLGYSTHITTIIIMIMVMIIMMMIIVTIIMVTLTIMTKLTITIITTTILMIQIVTIIIIMTFSSS